MFEAMWPGVLLMHVNVSPLSTSIIVVWGGVLCGMFGL